MASPRGWQEFLKKINTSIDRPGIYTLEYVSQFRKALGNPGQDLKIIHVAGTNAKGTVTFKLAKMLELSGYKTGLFLSPHLFSWRERVQINSQLIPKEYCGEFLDKYKFARNKLGFDLSFFEFFWVLALDYFEYQKVDAAVIEVGLGGRLDATNIMEKSLLSIITSISLDHTQILGNTVEEICGRSYKVT